MPKREIRPAEKPDKTEVAERMKRDQAAQDNYDASAERNAEALAQDPAQQELYRREREGGGTLLGEETKKAPSPANKALRGPSATKERELPDGSPRAARKPAKKAAKKKAARKK